MSGATTVAIGVFAAAYGTNVSTSFLVLYQERLNLGQSATQAIFVVYVAGILGTLLVIGQIADRVGKRTIVVPFLGLSALGSLVMIFGRDHFILLLVGRFLLGVVSGAVLSVGTAWLQSLLGPGNEQKAAVLSTVVTYGGFGIGPLSSALIAHYLPWPLVLAFVVHIVLTLAVIPMVARVPDPSGTGVREPIRIRLGVPEGARRGFTRIIVPAAIWVFAFPSTSFALFPVLISDSVSGSPVIIAGLAGTLTAFAGMLARPIVNRFGVRPTMPASMFAGLVGYLLGLIAFTTGAWPLVFPAAILLGGASGVITADCLALLGALATEETRGQVTSTFYLLAYPGMAMPLLITSIAAGASVSVALAIIATLSLLCAIWVTRVMHEPITEAKPQT